MRFLSIKSKIIIMLLLVSGMAAAILAYMGYQSAKKSITDGIINKLTSVRANKARQVEDYFKGINKLVYTIGQNQESIEALRGFDQAFHGPEMDSITPGQADSLRLFYNDFIELLSVNLDIDPNQEFFLPSTYPSAYLQYHYIASNPNELHEKSKLNSVEEDSPYHKVHEKYHPYFRRLKEDLGFEDILLIDVNTADIIYSVNKTPEFATNLRTGPYQGSNLAELLETVSRDRDLRSTRLVDFRAYRPACGEPAAFAATPVFDGSDLVGILACQLSIDKINEVITGGQNWEQEGLGKTGEALILGEDLYLRSDLRVLLETPELVKQHVANFSSRRKIWERMLRLGTSVMLLKVATNPDANPRSDTAGIAVVDDIQGKKALVCYAPLDIQDLKWIIAAKQEISEAYANLFAFQREILIAMVIIVLVLVLFSLLLAQLFTRPFEKIIQAAKLIAQGKDEKIVNIRSRDEFGELASSFNTMVESIQKEKTQNEEQNLEIEKLLLNILPVPIAERLKNGERQIADNFSNVTILFANITGFIENTSSLPGNESAARLNELISAFDKASEKLGVEKIKSFGDSYMAVSGLTIPRLDHEKRMADFALEMVDIIHRYNINSEDLNLRIGIHSGEVTAGVIGIKKFIYDVWGTNVNLAFNLMNHCATEENRINVSNTIYENLKDLYHFDPLPELTSKYGLTMKAWSLSWSGEEEHKK